MLLNIRQAVQAPPPTYAEPENSTFAIEMRPQTTFEGVEVSSDDDYHRFDRFENNVQ
jgi:hypothetical protein